MRRRILLRARPARDPEAEQRERDAFERTQRVLLGLPEQQWTVVSPFEQRHGPPGHVLVGPGGVYLIFSRQPDGSVRVKDGVPWLRRRADRERERSGTDVVRKAIEPAQALAREIRSLTGRGPTVHPVVVLWCEFPQRVAETNQVAYVNGRELAGWLRARPPEIDRPGLDEIAQAAASIAAEHARRFAHRPRSRAA